MAMGRKSSQKGKGHLNPNTDCSLTTRFDGELMVQSLGQPVRISYEKSNPFFKTRSRSTLQESGPKEAS